jgi:hypothetical protein
VHSDILDRYPAAKLKVYAVWFDMLTGDSRQFLDTRALGDPRVTYYWDEGKVVGRWFSANVAGREDVTWDAYFLYGPDAQWGQQLGPLVSSSDSGVIGSTDQLTAAIRPFLSG